MQDRRDSQYTSRKRGEPRFNGGGAPGRDADRGMDGEEESSKRRRADGLGGRGPPPTTATASTSTATAARAPLGFPNETRSGLSTSRTVPDFVAPAGLLQPPRPLKPLAGAAGVPPDFAHFDGTVSAAPTVAAMAVASRTSAAATPTVPALPAAPLPFATAASHRDPMPAHAFAHAHAFGHAHAHTHVGMGPAGHASQAASFPPHWPVPGAAATAPATTQSLPLPVGAPDGFPALPYHPFMAPHGVHPMLAAQHAMMYAGQPAWGWGPHPAAYMGMPPMGPFATRGPLPHAVGTGYPMGQAPAAAPPAAQPGIFRPAARRMDAPPPGSDGAVVSADTAAAGGGGVADLGDEATAAAVESALAQSSAHQQQQMSRRPVVISRRSGATLTLDDVRELFDMSLSDAAVQCSMSAASFKRACERLGIQRWPFRQLRALEQRIQHLRARLFQAREHGYQDAFELQEMAEELASCTHWNTELRQNPNLLVTHSVFDKTRSKMGGRNVRLNRKPPREDGDSP